MPNARFRLVAETPDTHGHGTHLGSQLKG